MTEATRIHIGHRNRMRNKLISHGSCVFGSYELLEMLLYYIIPYKDTNPVAKRLMMKFGSVNAVFTATRDELMSVEGVGAETADFLLTAAPLILDPFADSKDEIYDNYDKIGEYFATRLSGLDRPVTAAMLFDNRMRLIDCGTVYELDYSSGGVRAEAFIDFAIKKNASVVITAHNHPHGPFFPTVGDMETNKLIKNSLHTFGIELIEHYLICGRKYIGIMNRLAFLFKQTPELERFYRSREESLNG